MRQSITHLGRASTSVQKTLAAGGLEEHIMRVSLIFAIIVSFLLFTVLGNLFQRISDSRFTWIHDFEENLTKLPG